MNVVLKFIIINLVSSFNIIKKNFPLLYKFKLILKYFKISLKKKKIIFRKKKYNFFFNKIKKKTKFKNIFLSFTNFRRFPTLLSFQKFKKVTKIIDFLPNVFYFFFELNEMIWKRLLKNNLKFIKSTPSAKKVKRFYTFYLLKRRYLWLLKKKIRLKKKNKMKKKIKLFFFFKLKKKIRVNSLSLKKKMSLFLYIKSYLKYVMFKSFRNYKIFKKVKYRNYRVSTFNSYFNKNLSKYLKYSKKDFLHFSFKKDVSVPRLKFKNNYIQLWKKARISFKKIFNLNYKYQKQLTRKLYYYSKFSFINFYFNFFKLKHTIQSIFYKFFTSNIIDLLSSKLIFLNGKAETNSDLILLKNDNLACLLFANLYLFINLIKKNIFIKKKKLFKWFLYNFKRVKYTFFKKKKQNLPKKIERYYYLKKDLPNFIEFDYIQLSGFILYNDLFLLNFLKHDFLKYNLYIYKNYNWKFIT